MVTRYVGNSVFQFRIYNMIWEEIIYPIAKEVAQITC